MSDAEKFKLEMMSTPDLAELARKYKREMDEAINNQKKREFNQKRKAVIRTIKSRQLTLL